MRYGLHKYCIHIWITTDYMCTIYLYILYIHTPFVEISHTHISLSLYTYIYIHICIIYIYMYVYTCLSLSLSVYVYVYIYIQIYVCNTYVCEYVYAWWSHTDTLTFIRGSLYVRTHINNVFRSCLSSAGSGEPSKSFKFYIYFVRFPDLLCLAFCWKELRRKMSELSAKLRAASPSVRNHTDMKDVKRIKRLACQFCQMSID